MVVRIELFQFVVVVDDLIYRSSGHCAYKEATKFPGYAECSYYDNTVNTVIDQHRLGFPLPWGRPTLVLGASIVGGGERSFIL